MRKVRGVRSWRWFDAVYGVKIVLITGGRLDEFTAWFEKRNKTELSTQQELDDLATGLGTAFLTRYEVDGPATIWFWLSPRACKRDAFGISTIGHEAIHATMALFRDKKMPIGKESEEAFAYYQTYLFTEVFKRLHQ